MSEVQEKSATSKKERDVEVVKMSDGRDVEFVGKRKMNKYWVNLEGGAVGVRFDLRNGFTRTFMVTDNALLTSLALHGASQKIGDEASGEEDVDDIQVAITTIMDRLEAGEWGKPRSSSGESFSGSGVVIKALCEVTGQSLDYIKDYLEKRLKGDTKLTRRDLYASFRNPNSATGKVIARLEAEKRAKSSKVDVDAELAALKAG